MLNLRLGFVCCCICLIGAGNLSAQRKLAPGVLNVIKPSIDLRDVHSLPMPLEGVKAEEYTPNFPPKTATLYGQTRNVVFFRDVWQFEFSFLGLRQLEIVARNKSGEARKKNIWYMVYRIRNTGQSVSHKDVEDPKFGHVDKEIELSPTELDPLTLSNRFFGRFVLQGWVEDSETGQYKKVSYSSRVAPQIVKLIQQEEDPDQELLDTIQMAQGVLEKVPADTDQGGKWGVAVWFNVDPEIDYVSVQVKGLTNAYRIVKTPGGELDFKFKTLQLNFWRPGDGLEQSEDVVDYGIPLVDDPDKQVAITRRYQLPGPVIRAEKLNTKTRRKRLLFEADAGIQMRDFESTVAAELDTGEIPQSIQQNFANAGYPLGGDAQLAQRIAGKQWTITDTYEGENRVFNLRLQPVFWEKSIDGGIRFLKRLDNFWVYQ